jgi:cytochrome c553
MKKVTLLSLAAAAVLFVACGEETKKSAAEATVAVKETAKVAVEETKETATQAVEATKEAAAPVVETAKVKAAEAVESVKEAVTPSDNAAGAAAYAKCAGCHGKDGKTKALGKSEVVAGQAAADLETKLVEYKAGIRNVSGMGTLMKGQVASMSDEDIKAVSEYMSSM